MRKILVIILFCFSFLVFSQSREELLKIVAENNVAIELLLTDNEILRNQMKVLNSGQTEKQLIISIEQLTQSNNYIEILLAENEELKTQLKTSTEQLGKNNEVLERAYIRIEDDAIEIAELRSLLANSLKYVKQSYYTGYVFGGFDASFINENSFKGGVGFNLRVSGTPLNFLFKIEGSINRIGLGIGFGFSF